MANITIIVNGDYKPTYNWGAPSCMIPYVFQSPEPWTFPGLNFQDKFGSRWRKSPRENLAIESSPGKRTTNTLLKGRCIYYQYQSNQSTVSNHFEHLSQNWKYNFPSAFSNHAATPRFIGLALPVLLPDIPRRQRCLRLLAWPVVRQSTRTTLQLARIGCKML